MPTLQELMPFLEQLSQQWLQLTLDNVAYAVALGASVWLVSAIIYNLRISAFKRRHVREQQAHQETQSRLASTQQELNAAQAQAGELSAQLEQSQQELDSKTQRITELEQHVQTSQHKLVESFASLVEKFELIETLPGKNDSNIEAIWERCNAIIERIAERFGNEQQAKARLQLDVQAEKIKTADKELLANNLQTQLNSQAEQIAQLERSVAEQMALRAELDDVKRQLAGEQARQASASARIAELERQTFTTATTLSPAPIVVSDKPAATPAVVERPVAEPPVVAESPAIVNEVAIPDQSSVEEPAAPIEIPQATVVETTPVQASAAAVVESPAPSANAGKSKWKNLFGNAMQQLSSIDEKLGSPGTSTAKPVSETPIHETAEVAQVTTIPEPVRVEPVAIDVEKPKRASAPAKDQPATATSDKKSWKNMLGNAMQQFAKMDEKLGSPTNVTPIIEEPQEEQITVIAESEPMATEATEKKAKFGGLFGKLKKK